MERKSIDENSPRKPSGTAVMRGELTAALFRALFERWARLRGDQPRARGRAGRRGHALDLIPSALYWRLVVLGNPSRRPSYISRPPAFLPP